MNITYDGTSLTNDANGIMATWPDDLGSPPIRGSNIVIPFKHGAIPVKKYYDSRSIVINGYVYAPTRAILWQRIDTLKQLCSIIDKGPRRLQFVWPDGSTRYLLAEPSNTLGLQGTHKTFSPFSIEFLCADPFFYDPGTAQEIAYRLNDPRHLRLSNPDLILADFDSIYDDNLVAQSNISPLPNNGIIPLTNAIFRFLVNRPMSNMKIVSPLGKTTATITGDYIQNDVLILDCDKWTLRLNDVDITNRLTTGLGQVAPVVIPIGTQDLLISFDTASEYYVTMQILYSAAYL